ncbi:hypothetical protein Esti_000152 [Eimeria stiedai]
MNAAAADTLRAAARCLPKAAVRLPAAGTWPRRGPSRQGSLSPFYSCPLFARAGSSVHLFMRSSSSSCCSSSSGSGELLGGSRIHLWCSVAALIQQKAYPLHGVYLRGPTKGPPSFVWLSVRSLSGVLPRATAYAAITKKQQRQRQSHRQEQSQQQTQQQQQPLAAAGRCDSLLAYPGSYASNYVPSQTAETESSSSSSTSSSSSVGVEVLGMLPAWARRLQPPKREVLFLRVLPVAPLVLMALGLHVLPPLGFEALARSCLSALIAYSATLLTAAAAVHAGMQLSELGFPAQRQHRGFYTVGRLGVSFFFVVHSLLVCGLLHEEPLNGIYLCIASAFSMLGFSARENVCACGWWLVGFDLHSGRSSSSRHFLRYCLARRCLPLACIAADTNSPDVVPRSESRGARNGFGDEASTERFECESPLPSLLVYASQPALFSTLQPWASRL